MIVQIIGHGDFETKVTDAFTIRFGNWKWQLEDPRYGDRADLVVGTDNRECVCDWMYCPKRHLQGNWLDITQYAEEYNTEKQWLSTGSVTILAAHSLWQPTLLLYGFTALESGCHQPRRAPTKGRETKFHDYRAERDYLERQGLDLRFVH